RRKGVRIKSLDQSEDGGKRWREIAVEDHRAGPAEVAIFRLDFEEWLVRLPSREREIAMVLGTGECTRIAAKKFSVTAGRISQLRAKLCRLWRQFQGKCD